MEPVVTIILTIGSICSAGLTLVAFFTLVFKKPKEWTKKWVKSIAKEEFIEQLKPLDDKLNELIEEAKKSKEREQVKIGHSIMTIYDRSMARGYITLADKKDLVNLHQDYKEVLGNHHVDEYFEIMMDMDVR